MTQPIFLSLPPILERHYNTLIRSSPTLREYYSQPDVAVGIETAYRNALKNTVPKTALGGGALAFVASWLAGLGVPATAAVTVSGVGGGAVAGALYETHRLAIAMRLDRGYIDWKNGMEQPVLEDFHSTLEGAELFQNLLCQITLDIPAVAVRDAWGRVYDQ